MEPSRHERFTYAYACHRATSLVAALNVATGHVIGAFHQRLRQQELVKFLEQIDQSIPKTTGETTHIAIDNDATHKTPRFLRRLARRPRNQVHFTPTSAAWLNPVERFFAKSPKSEFTAVASGASNP